MRSRFWRRVFVLPCLMMFLAPGASWASWQFNATLYSTCPHGASIAAGIVLPTLGPFPNQGMCESLRAYALSLTVQTTDCSVCSGPGASYFACSIGYHCSACSGSDDASMTGGSIDVNGDVTGQPYFTPHYGAAFSSWYNESLDRMNAFPTASTADQIQSWFRGSWFDVPPQVLLRLPGAMGPDADFYHTLAVDEYGSDKQKRAITSGKSAEPPPAAEKPKASSDQEPTESDYFYKLQLRQTGDAIVPAGSAADKLNGPSADSLSYVVAGDTLSTDSKPALDVTQAAKDLYDKAVDKAEDKGIEKLNDMADQVGDSMTDGEFSKYHKTSDALNGQVGETMNVIQQGVNLLLSGNYSQADVDNYWNSVVGAGKGWINTAADRAKAHMPGGE